MDDVGPTAATEKGQGDQGQGDQGQGEEERLDPVAETILALLRAEPPGGSVDPAAVARLFAEGRRKPGDPSDIWRRWLPAVRQQSRHLARRGLIVILRHGVPVDPKGPIKGLVRLALPAQNR